MTRRSLPHLLGLLLVAGCGGVTEPQLLTPPTCLEGDCTLLTCRQLTSEQACLARGDCAPYYDGKSFAGCAPALCPALACDLACAHGLARDASGCDLCACGPAPCLSDLECDPGERCLFPALKCPAGASCVPETGVCGRVETSCGSDAECAKGETCVFPKADCPPGAFCAPPRGTCRPSASGCLSDWECGFAKACVNGGCIERKPCKSEVECLPGESCAFDPADPCVKSGNCETAYKYCTRSCTGLGEKECHLRPDCRAYYGGVAWPVDDHGAVDAGAAPQPPSDVDAGVAVPPVPPSDLDGGMGWADAGPATGFLGCGPALCPEMACKMYCPNGFRKDAAGCEICECNQACPAVMCDMYCPNGYKKDAAGCDQCACNEGCKSDAECMPGQFCALPAVAPCASDKPCPPVEVLGTCVWKQQGCASDSDCAAGEKCQLYPYDAAGNAGCSAGADGGCATPAWGMCVPAPISCSDDNACPAGQRCNVVNPPCPAGETCPVKVGVCEIEKCETDAECRAGETCIPAPWLSSCAPGDPTCPNGICVLPPKGCASDADCPAGQTCQPDPSDPCNDPNSGVACFAPGEKICK